MKKNSFTNVEILKKEQKIVVDGYYGRWSVIDSHNQYLLLEHNAFGDETCLLVVDSTKVEWRKIRLKNGAEVMRACFAKAFETYDDIITCLVDEGIL